jgi:hypothetical protein
MPGETRGQEPQRLLNKIKDIINLKSGNYETFETILHLYVLILLTGVNTFMFWALSMLAILILNHYKVDCRPVLKLNIFCTFINSLWLLFVGILHGAHACNTIKCFATLSIANDQSDINWDFILVATFARYQYARGT